ncbi:HEPN domain-containing protein [Candidatus Woesearchaeota archaeon]|nr:HEPN domain-containing protein [Candidatus Woesearchaeota archaeon]
MKEEKLGLVEPSEDICSSYIGKSSDCLRSAKILFQNSLYENSVAMSYYAMYNLLLALLFRAGIKCENHSGSILLLKLLFDKVDLSNMISDGKKERIDRQYYITTKKDELTKGSAGGLLDCAESFVLDIRSLISNLDNESIEELRKSFKVLVG